MRYVFLSVSALGTIFSILLPHETLAAPSGIIMSEVSIAGEKASDEFVELYNTTDAAFDLSGLQLRRRTQSGSESSLKVFPKGTLIPAHGYFLWANSQGIFHAPFADTETSSSALANDNSIGLFTASGNDGALLDSLAWGGGTVFSSDSPVLPNPPKGTALTRDTTTRKWSPTESLTPTNSRGEAWTPPILEPPTAPPVTPKLSVRFNEILANPSGDDGQGEFIELYNAGDAEIALDGFRIKDASKTGEYVFPSGTLLPAQEYFVLPRSASQISLNNSDETLSLLDQNLTLIDSVHYAKIKEGVSLNFTPSGWRGGTPTPGAKNQPNTLPETSEKVPKKGYRGVPVTFDARGKDADGDHLKHTWDFGDNHKSYKEETTHTYDDNGTYTVTLTTTDGSDDVVETFTLKIEALPKPEVRIAALIPNPSGRDTDSEWILIENRSKKAIDLQGFGIATGWKKLVNHPIRESLVIKPGKSVILTRQHALFILPNQKSKIELRSPDGTVLQKIKYKLDKEVGEDTVYFKEKGRAWAWKNAGSVAPVDPEPESDQLIPLPLSDVTPTVPDIDPLPEEIPPSDAPAPEQVLGAAIVLPEAMSESAPNEVPPLAPEHTSAAPFFDWFQNFFLDLNAWLNDWQNSRHDVLDNQVEPF
jgi:PKD repeat protein